jgi:hypothetical protein
MKLSILFVGEYKEYPYMVQVFHSELDNQYAFQYLIHKDGEGFFQGHNIIHSDIEGAALSQEQVVQGTVLMKDMAMATIETLLKKKDPTYVVENERLGQDVLDVMQSMKENEEKLKPKVN